MIGAAMNQSVMLADRTGSPEIKGTEGEEKKYKKIVSLFKQFTCEVKQGW